MSEQNTTHPSLENSKPLEKAFQQFNGVHSSNSSRSSSPSIRLGQIPSSQLPPSRPIPQSQLPPSRSPVTAITQQVSGLNVNTSTPKTTNTNFSTSTPNLQLQPGFSPSGGPSPVGMTAPGTNLNLNQRVGSQTSGTGAYFNEKQPVIMNSISSVNQLNMNSFPTNSSLDKQVPSLAGSVTSNGHNIEQLSKPSNSFSQNPRATSAFPQQGSAPNPVQPQISKNINFGSTTPQFAQPKNVSQLLQQPKDTNHLPNPSFVPVSSSNMRFIQPNSSNLNPGQTPGYPASQSLVNNSIVQAPRPLLQNTTYKPNLLAGQRPPNPNYNYPNSQQMIPPMPNNQSQQLPLNRNNVNNFVPPQNIQTQSMPVQSFNTFNAHIPSSVPPQQHPVQPLPPSQPGLMNQPQVSQLPPQNKPNLHSNRYPSTPPAASPAYAKHPQAVQPNSYMPQASQNQQSVPYSQPNSYQSQSPIQQNAYNQQHKGVAQLGYNKMWGTESFDLIQTTNILPPKKEDPPKVHLGQELLDQANCTPDIFRCTMTKIPENNTLLQKSRLPLGVLIHPFKDLSHLPVIQCNVIVRCRACRTYINPFVFFVDSKRWKCNLCYR